MNGDDDGQKGQKLGGEISEGGNGEQESKERGEGEGEDGGQLGFGHCLILAFECYDENVRRRWQWVDGILGLGLIFLAVGVGMEYRTKVVPKTEVEIIKNERRVVGESGGRILVDVGGAVEKAGVYKLEGGARIKGALVAAGGLSAGADRDWVEKNLNQAGEVWDGMKIYVPKMSEVLGSSEQVRGGKINLNTASQKELEELPGIGPAMAGRIIEYRQANSGFRNVEEVKLVKGIGEKLFEKMKDWITI